MKLRKPEPPPSKYFWRRVADDCAAWGPFTLLFAIFLLIMCAIHALADPLIDQLWNLFAG
ncbi:MAG: hypothetical protein QOE70_4739 [Chthoniobacter sp.]|jgi:hypothetical protein|nr:hypothetical protein [Chthoniobacter sp.]